jgi:hypothetical protein
MTWRNKKEVKNQEVVIAIIVSIIAGFTWAYLHWGLGVPWI